MARVSDATTSSAPFFAATLVLWSVSVLFEIGVNKRKELVVIVGGVFFFQISNWVIRRFVSKDPLFVNTSVSLLHSTLVSVSVVVILLNQWIGKGLVNILEHEQLFGGTWLGAYSALCFSCSYFAYDQWDMLRYRLYSGWIPTILVHHLILLVCFTLALYRFIPYFLHIRKVWRMEWSCESRVDLNWVTFFVARLGCHVLITYKLIVDAPKFGKGIELPLALFGMIGMNLLNIFLGLDLFKAYRREKTQQKSRD